MQSSFHAVLSFENFLNFSGIHLLLNFFLKFLLIIILLLLNDIFLKQVLIILGNFVTSFLKLDRLLLFWFVDCQAFHNSCLFILFLVCNFADVFLLLLFYKRILKPLVLFKPVFFLSKLHLHVLR
jgi:hypothetical protein